jgi:hypothetical protein
VPAFPPITVPHGSDSFPYITVPKTWLVTLCCIPFFILLFPSPPPPALPDPLQGPPLTLGPSLVGLDTTALVMTARPIAQWMRSITGTSKITRSQG